MCLASLAGVQLCHECRVEGHSVLRGRRGHMLGQQDTYSPHRALSDAGSAAGAAKAARQGKGCLSQSLTHLLCIRFFSHRHTKYNGTQCLPGEPGAVVQNKIKIRRRRKKENQNINKLWCTTRVPQKMSVGKALLRMDWRAGKRKKDWMERKGLGVVRFCRFHLSYCGSHFHPRRRT